MIHHPLTSLQFRKSAAPTSKALADRMLQRKCACGQHTVGGGECTECRKKRVDEALRAESTSGGSGVSAAGVLQRRAVGARGERAEAPPIVHEVLREPGQPLDAGTREFMEARFGRVPAYSGPLSPLRPQGKLAIGEPGDAYEREADQVAERVVRMPAADRNAGAVTLSSGGRVDFGHVRVHTGAKAAESARAVGALAYTVGRDVVFGAGQYAPGTGAGRRLVAHELVHVGQQRRTMQPKTLSIEPSHGTHECEAYHVADIALQMSRSSVTSSFIAPNLLYSSSSRRLFRRTEEGKNARIESSNDGSRSTGNADATPSESTGLCLRTPLPPGQVRFHGCLPEQANNFAVISETGNSLTTPVNDTWYDTDGFWHRSHKPRIEWFKIPGHCDTDVTCVGEDFSYSCCCNVLAKLKYGVPRWVTDPHSATNPF